MRRWARSRACRGGPVDARRWDPADHGHRQPEREPGSDADAQRRGNLRSGSGQTTTINGIIAGSGSLTKVGAGTLALTAANTYTGGTIVNGGTLAAYGPNSASSTLGGGNVAVNNGGTIIIGGWNALVGYAPSASNTITINGGGLIADGGGNTNHLNALVLGGGTLAETGAANATYGNWNPDYGVSTPGNGSTSYITGGNLALTQSGGTVFNVGAGDTLNVSTVLAHVSGVSDTGLVKQGGGVLVLSGQNTYTGGTTVSAGTLALRSGGSLGTGNLTIVPGGILDASALAGGYTFSGGVFTAGRAASYATDVHGTLNLSNATVNLPAGNAVLTIDGNLGGSGATWNYAPGDRIALGGALNLSGADYIAPLAPLGPGVYTLYTYKSGTPNLSDLATTGIFGSSPRQSYVFRTSGGTAVTLTVTGAVGNLQWTGGSNQTWDTAASQSWYNLSSSAADSFYTGDSVTFNDTPGTAATVNISGTVLPGSVTVSNTSANYTFRGPGSIGGGTSLVKNGPGGLTLATANTYNGGTIVNGGTLETSSPNNAGTNYNQYGVLGFSSPIAVNSGATISVADGNNSLVGYSTSGTRQIQVNAGGLLINSLDNGNGFSTAHLNALVLDGGTLSSVASDAAYGSWDPDYGISTPGNGRTSYITGGNLALTQSGGTVFNVARATRSTSLRSSRTPAAQAIPGSSSREAARSS